MTRRLLTVGVGLGLLVAPLVGAEVPRPAPEFVIRPVNGPQILLSKYRGKVIALEFLQTTCPHCQNCSALLNNFYKEYGPRGFQPVGVAFNDFAAMLVPDYVSSLQLTFPVGIGTREEVMSYLQFPMVERMYVPQLIFIDRKGIIRAQYGGDNDFFKNEEANMRAQIESLLKEPAERPRTAAPKSSKPKPAAKAASLSRSQALK